MAEPERRRRRPPVSCTLCRKRKIRCNREHPCNNCLRSSNATCVYDNYGPQPPRHPVQSTEQRLPQVTHESDCATATEDIASTSRGSNNGSRPSTSLFNSPTAASTPASEVSARDVELMKSRIRQLEDQLSKTSQSPANNPTWSCNIKATASSVPAPFSVLHESQLSGGFEVLPCRSVMHKNRLFGQSHWINGLSLFRDMIETIELYLRAERTGSSNAVSNIERCKALFSGVQRCKALGKLIKSRRAPPWPPPPTSRADFPPKEIADQLVDCYLRTTESVYRILHIPSFKREYEALWASEAEPDAAFFIQIKLVLAIGATTYDEQFSLRPSAIRWVYEAQAWDSEPEFKSRLSIQSLQNSLLLLLARETAGVGASLIWTTIGTLHRTAVYMGLHRDPAFLPKESIFIAEMRRRLWNTIMEIALQSSLNSGGPPLISLGDFNTQPPRNFNDDHLLAENPLPVLEDVYTQASVAIALRKTFPCRLAIARYLNDLSSHGTYEEMLRLDGDISLAYKTLCQTLQGIKSSTGRCPSLFETRVVDFVMRRFHSALHVPLYGQSLHEKAYAYSRKIVVETSLQLWYTAYPPSSAGVMQCRRDETFTERDDFARFVTCSSGFFRMVAHQACFMLGAELKNQLLEAQSLGPVPLRLDLVSVIGDAQTRALQSIEAGETNIKGYLFLSLTAAYIDGLTTRVKRDDLPALLLKAAEKAEETCLPILEKKVAESHAEGSLDGLDQMTLNTPSELAENWDFMMSDAQFDIGNAEPMSWFLSDEIAQAPSLW